MKFQTDAAQIELSCEVLPSYLVAYGGFDTVTGRICDLLRDRLGALDERGLESVLGRFGDNTRQVFERVRGGENCPVPWKRVLAELQTPLAIEVGEFLCLDPGINPVRMKQLQATAAQAVPDPAIVLARSVGEQAEFSAVLIQALAEYDVLACARVITAA